jgi:hypothetical protein
MKLAITLIIDVGGVKPFVIELELDEVEGLVDVD